MLGCGSRRNLHVRGRKAEAARSEARSLLLCWWLVQWQWDRQNFSRIPRTSPLGPIPRPRPLPTPLSSVSFVLFRSHSFLLSRLCESCIISRNLSVDSENKSTIPNGSFQTIANVDELLNSKMSNLLPSSKSTVIREEARFRPHRRPFQWHFVWHGRKTYS